MKIPLYRLVRGYVASHIRVGFWLTHEPWSKAICPVAEMDIGIGTHRNSHVADVPDIEFIAYAS